MKYAVIFKASYVTVIEADNENEAKEIAYELMEDETEDFSGQIDEVEVVKGDK